MVLLLVSKYINITGLVRHIVSVWVYNEYYGIKKGWLTIQVESNLIIYQNQRQSLHAFQ